jgi:hypothetical protein
MPGIVLQSKGNNFSNPVEIKLGYKPGEDLFLKKFQRPYAKSK